MLDEDQGECAWRVHAGLRRLVAIGGAWLLIAVVAGCGGLAARGRRGDAGRRGTNAQRESRLVRVPTSRYSCWTRCPRNRIVADDYVTGVLAGSPKVAGGCVWLDFRATRVTVRVPVLWPPGFRARLDPVELLAPGGRVVARGGDRLVLGGLQVSARGRRCMLGQRHAIVIVGGVSAVRPALAAAGGG